MGYEKKKNAKGKKNTLGRLKGNKKRHYDNTVMIINNLSVMVAIKIGSKKKYIGNKTLGRRKCNEKNRRYK